jgi:hypothetical protein
MWQDIIVSIIGLSTLVILIRKLVLFFTKKQKANSCVGCPGCGLKNELKRH